MNFAREERRVAVRQHAVAPATHEAHVEDGAVVLPSLAGAPLR
jgi:hypothetical protein